MRITKMHGIGNDYVYVNGFEQDVADPSNVAKRISDRHFGVGSDGLILILPPTDGEADVRMRMFNADGSEGQMCGNGIRCVAKYAWDHDLSRANPLRVETPAGIKSIDLQLGRDGRVRTARVDMGRPILDAGAIPTTFPGPRVVDEPIEVAGERFALTCVSMGNPHAVIYVEDVATVPLEQLGPPLETHERFPEKSNVHFVQVHGPGEVTMRTWERGSGVTLACGTGASAVCVAGVLTGRCGRDVFVHLPGGELTIEWDEQSDHLFMTGPAAEVFCGEWFGMNEQVERSE